MSKYHRQYIYNYREFIAKDLQYMNLGDYYIQEFRPGRVLVFFDSGEVYMYNLTRGWKSMYRSYQAFLDRMNPITEEGRVQLIRDEIDTRMRLMGYTQDSLAYEVGISQTKMSRLLNREYIPDYLELWKFAEAFECDLIEMLDFSGSLN